MRYIASATSNDPLINRAFAAYYRNLHREGFTDQQINIPANDSHRCEHDGKEYVVLHNIRGVLAVYRVRNDGILKGLKRWPKAIEEP